MINPLSPKVNFKAYEQHLSQLFRSMATRNHLVRLISKVIDKVELDRVLHIYPGGSIRSKQIVTPATSTPKFS